MGDVPIVSIADADTLPQLRDISYATHLYRVSGHDLEVVQERLGHASIKTTTIYARVTKEDKLRAANALAKAYRGTRSGAGGWPRARRPTAVGAQA